MSVWLIRLVDDYVTHLKKEYGDNKVCIVHEAWANDGHDPNGQHPLGTAVDLHIEGLSLLTQYLEAERFPFTGIGVYPYWRTPGLHLDVRELRGYHGARWWRDNSGNYREPGRELFKLITED